MQLKLFLFIVVHFIERIKKKEQVHYSFKRYNSKFKKKYSV